VIIGIGSSGPHSNGYSLVRRVVERSGLAWDAPCPFEEGKTLAEALMAPTRIYVKSILPLLQAGPGQGRRPHHRRRPDREPAALHRRGPGPAVRLERLAPAAGVRLAAARGRHQDHELRRTFNCGVGFILVVAASDAEPVLAALLNAGEDAFICGQLGRGLVFFLLPLREKVARVAGRMRGCTPHRSRLTSPSTPHPSAFADTFSRKGRRRGWIMTQKTKVAVLISGRGSNMEALVRAAQDPACPFEIALVLSNKPEAGGLLTAAAAGVEALAIDQKPFGKDREAHERAIDAALRERGIEVVALAGYMRILTPFLVEAWAGRMLNIHPSLLPKYPGLDTHGRALTAGEVEAGCTVHLVTAGVDEGPSWARPACRSCRATPSTC
jgi:phosphoribosylglycinamide formyltransferase-1